MLKNVSFAVAALSMAALSLQAQERAAGGPVETQMTWSALNDLVKAANVKIEGVNSRIDQIVVCGTKGWTYAPGAPGADAQGCKEPVTAAGLKLTRVSHYAGDRNQTVTTGWHSFCIPRWSHNDSNLWYGVVGGPDANGKMRFSAANSWGPQGAGLICFD